MYDAILVDDEEVVLQGLQNHLNWHKHNVQIVGVFPDGQKAWNYVRNHPVDLVVTDVCTPYMDGIELAKMVRKEHPQTKILFISGHADVGYLKDALKLDAVDYILKSIDLDEMSATLSRIVAMIDDERLQAKQFSDMEELLSRSMPLLRNRRLLSLLHESEEDEDTVLSELKYLGISLENNKHYIVMVVRLANKWQVIGDMNDKERMLFSLKIQTICEDILKNHNSSIFLKDRMSEYILIVNAEGEDCEETFLNVSNEVRNQLLDDLGAEVSIGISSRFSSVLKIKAAYQSACEAIEKHYLIDDSLPVSVNKYEEIDDLKNTRERAEKWICEAIMNGNAEQVHKVRRSFIAIARQIPSIDEQQNFLIFMLMLPAKLLTNIPTEDKGKYASQRSLMEQFLLCQNHEEQDELIAQVYEDVSSVLKNRSDPHSTSVVSHVKRIIQQRYADRLSIKSLAQEVYLTPTYLCVLFKQQTGKTINEYITSERIQHAKELLADSNILLYDICFMVGYLSPSYFSKLFKKYTSMTPSEYREHSILGFH